MFDLTLERESSMVKPLKYQTYIEQEPEPEQEPFLDDDNVEVIGNTINDDQTFKEETKNRRNKIAKPEIINFKNLKVKTFDCKLNLNLKRANSDGKQNEKSCECGRNTFVLLHQNLFLRPNRNDRIERIDRFNRTDRSDKNNNTLGKNSNIREVKGKINWNFTTYDYNLILTGKLKVEKKINKLKTTIVNVCEWRALSKDIGQTNANSNDPKEEAAKILGLKKKSLDDYLMYLRLGIVLQYDFSSNLDIKFGNLRKYVKEYRLNLKWDKNRHADVESLLPLTKSELIAMAKPELVHN